jgi:membrane protease YdiL (CAAX protease family)
MIQKQHILRLALATIVVMPLIAVIIDKMSDTVDLSISIIGYQPLWQQIGVGLISGIIIAFLAQKLISSPILNKVNLQYARMLGNFKLSWSEIVFISVCAGVGEELLFRGAIQPLLGFVLTSMIFVAIHGYINPYNWRLSVYGLFMTLAIMGLGLICNYFGLIAPIIAHTIIDVYLLHYLQKTAELDLINIDETDNEDVSMD